jgi:multisubunit Na+/H+ antiporter MnhC subunit
MAIALLFVFITTYLTFYMLIKTGFRAKLEEVVGLDIVDHGVRVE